MPANKKYLTHQIHHRVAKILAGFLGGYLITQSLFLLLAQHLDRAAVMVTMIFGGFVVWAGLMICAFLFRNGWLALVLYLGVAAIFSGLYSFNIAA